MRLNLPVLLVVFLMIVGADHGVADDTITTELGKKVQIVSSVMGESREVWVHLPKNYHQSEDLYPVLVILDGESHFGHTVNAVTLLHEMERIPDLIVVAVPNNGKRTRDLSREKDRFKRFINDELIDMVNKTYRTTGHKTLFGHSLAGYFTLNMMVTEVGAFDNYIAASPVIQVRKAELLDQVPALFTQHPKMKKSLYLTLTSPEEEGRRAAEAMNRFVALLEKSAPGGLSWQYTFIPDQIHMTTPYLTVYKGLSKVFRDYQSPGFTTYQAYQESGGMPALKKYYQARGQKYGVAQDITSDAISQLGFMLMDEGQSEIALQIFTDHTKQHPQSEDAFGMLGNAHARLKQYEKAVVAYQSAWELAKNAASPNADFYVGRINRLKQALTEK